MQLLPASQRARVAFREERYGMSAKDHVLLLRFASVPYDYDNMPDVSRAIVAGGEPLLCDVWLISL